MLRAASSAVPLGGADEEVHRFAIPRGPYATGRAVAWLDGDFDVRPGEDARHQGLFGALRARRQLRSSVQSQDTPLVSRLRM